MKSDKRTVCSRLKRERVPIATKREGNAYHYCNADRFEKSVHISGENEAVSL